MTEKDEIIDEMNFREYARKAVAKYFEKHLLADAFFWREVVRLYEQELNKKCGLTKAGKEYYGCKGSAKP